MAISNPDSFRRDTRTLGEQQYDVLIIGGGISGAWLALHAAQSGYRTALIEASDYASQTSSSSSKLLHGGVRYLQQFEFGRVRESALERAHYIYAAPHLSVPVPFLVPTYKDFRRSKMFLNCGMLAYRLLTLGENKVIADKQECMPPISSMDKAQLSSIIELGDQELTGAVQFYERHMVNSERMVLAILQSAAAHGAHIANYCRARKLNKDGNRVCGVTARDELGGEEFTIDSRLVINAAGPWIDELNSLASNKPPSINGFAVGSHIITRQISDHAIALTTKHQSNAKLDRGGRHIFVIPWCGYSLIGTSYEEISHPQRDLLLQQSQVEQLLDAINEALPGAALSKEDLISGFSGLYPLRTEEIKNSVYQGSGEYVIVDHAEADQIDGLITALGAKFTTGRKLSALTMKRAQKKLGGRVLLHKTRLASSNYDSFSEYQHKVHEQYRSLLSEPTLDHLLRHYGSETETLLSLAHSDEALLTPISCSARDINAQIAYAVRYEQASTLEDVLYRRSSVGFFEISASEVNAASELMGKMLEWSQAKCAEQAQTVMDRIHSIRKTLAAAAEQSLAA